MSFKARVMRSEINLAASYTGTPDKGHKQCLTEGCNNITQSVRHRYCTQCAEARKKEQCDAFTKRKNQMFIYNAF